MHIRARRSRDGRDWASSAYEFLRPYVNHALSDERIQAALREAAEAGGGVARELEGSTPRGAGRKLATDRELQGEIGRGAKALGESAVMVAEAGTEARRPGGRGQRPLAIVGLISLAGLTWVALARRRGVGSEDATRAPEPAG